MDDITKTLQRLASTFTTRDIMVTEERLKCADSLDQALQKLTDNPSFDVIPIKKTGNLTDYLKRGEDLSKPIKRDDLISDSTPILELASILCKREFCFILVGDRVSGYVHFSDLNNQLVKIPFYVLLEAVESQIVSKLADRDVLSNLDIVVPNRAKSIKNKMRNLSRGRAERSLFDFMNMSDLLELAGYFQLLKLPAEELYLIKEIRNSVAHATRPLLNTQDDAKKLLRTIEICSNILEQLNSIS